MKTKIITTIVGIQGALIATASAHPGPPGHTHGDEWPFGMIITIAAVAFGAGLVARKVWSRQG